MTFFSFQTFRHMLSDQAHVMWTYVVHIHTKSFHCNWFKDRPSKTTGMCWRCSLSSSLSCPEKLPPVLVWFLSYLRGKGYGSWQITEIYKSHIKKFLKTICNPFFSGVCVLNCECSIRAFWEPSNVANVAIRDTLKCCAIHFPSTPLSAVVTSPPNASLWGVASAF